MCTNEGPLLIKQDTTSKLRELVQIHCNYLCAIHIKILPIVTTMPFGAAFLHPRWNPGLQCHIFCLCSGIITSTSLTSLAPSALWIPKFWPHRSFFYRWSLGVWVLAAASWLGSEYWLLAGMPYKQGYVLSAPLQEAQGINWFQDLRTLTLGSLWLTSFCNVEYFLLWNLYMIKYYN